MGYLKEVKKQTPEGESSELRINQPSIWNAILFLTNMRKFLMRAGDEAAKLGKESVDLNLPSFMAGKLVEGHTAAEILSLTGEASRRSTIAEVLNKIVGNGILSGEAFGARERHRKNTRELLGLFQNGRAAAGLLSKIVSTADATIEKMIASESEKGVNFNEVWGRARLENLNKLLTNGAMTPSELDHLNKFVGKAFGELPTLLPLYKLVEKFPWLKKTSLGKFFNEKKVVQSYVERMILKEASQNEDTSTMADARQRKGEAARAAKASDQDGTHSSKPTQETEADQRSFLLRLAYEKTHLLGQEEKLRQDILARMKVVEAVFTKKARKSADKTKLHDQVVSELCSLIQENDRSEIAPRVSKIVTRAIDRGTLSSGSFCDAILNVLIEGSRIDLSYTPLPLTHPKVIDYVAGDFAQAFFAASETTFSLITTGVVELANQPKVFAELQEEARAVFPNGLQDITVDVIAAHERLPKLSHFILWLFSIGDPTFINQRGIPDPDDDTKQEDHFINLQAMSAAEFRYHEENGIPVTFNSLVKGIHFGQPTYLSTEKLSYSNLRKCPGGPTAMLEAIATFVTMLLKTDGITLESTPKPSKGVTHTLENVFVSFLRQQQ